MNAVKQGPALPHKSQEESVSYGDFLPGADRFFYFLCSRYPGKRVRVAPYVVLDRSYEMEYAKRYDILVDGRTVGAYTTFGPRPGEVEYMREYQGEIPDYVNDAIAVYNRHSREYRPENQVALVFSNERFHAARFDSPRAPGWIETTPWQRQDGHAALTEFP